jgi:nucleoside-diphosphate-sugar epimerase
MTTVVTGAGLIGAAFAQNAIARGEKIVFVDPEPRADFLKLKLGEKGWALARADVRDLPTLCAVFKGQGATTVVHTAGLIGNRVQQSLNAGFDINLGGTRNVAEAVRLTGVKRLVHISTFGVYDRRRESGLRVVENFTRGGARAYGAFKAAKELILEAYADAYKFEVIMLRPANVFGVGHFWSGSSGGMKMQRLLLAGIDGGTARIRPSETVPNEYIYAKDVGTAVDAAATAKMPPQIHFNIGTGIVSTFDDVLAAVKKVCPNVRFELEPGDVPQKKIAPLDISAAKRHLNWAPKFTLQSAFEDYVKDLKAVRPAANLTVRQG